MVYLGKSVEKDMFFGAKPELFTFAREMRKSPTKAEKELWAELRKFRNKGFVFRRQHPIDIFIADFYCPALKLVIEVDGEIHEKKEKAEYDIGRTAELEKSGIKVLRFRNIEITTGLTMVVEKINEFITKAPPLSRERGIQGVR